MKSRTNDYYYKACDLDKKSSLDKKRYEMLNEFGYNFASNKERTINQDKQFYCHKNSDCH